MKNQGESPKKGTRPRKTRPWKKKQETKTRIEKETGQSPIGPFAIFSKKLQNIIIQKREQNPSSPPTKTSQKKEN